MFLQRHLQLPPLLAKKSFFLMGPRATGKSSLIKQQFGDQCLLINLLRSDVFLQLSEAPWQLESIIATRTAEQSIVVIDEIQKIPLLLNEVHRLIEDEGIRFLLTGSSARKLKVEHANLLAGRARLAHLFPLTYPEIPDFSLARFLQFGGLPNVYLNDEPEEELIAYVDTYLIQEIQAEAMVRQIQNFAKFLKFAALMNGKMLNFSALASDVAISASTIREYYHILEDTLLGFMLPAWVKTQKRKALSTAKFYFFDTGVAHQLMGLQHLEEASDAYGRAFEHFIAMELKAYLSYQRIRQALSFWCTKHGQEVDFIIGDDVAIEVKASKKVSDKHLKNLKLLQEEQICSKYYLISHDKVNRFQDNIHIIHWEDFLHKLWADEVVSS